MAGNNGPVATVSVPAGQGSQVQASVWANDVRKGQQSFTAYSVTIQRRYNDDGEWKSANGFRQTDLLLVAYVAQKAYDLLIEKKSRD